MIDITKVNENKKERFVSSLVTKTDRDTYRLGLLAGRTMEFETKSQLARSRNYTRFRVVTCIYALEQMSRWIMTPDEQQDLHDICAKLRQRFSSENWAHGTVRFGLKTKVLNGHNQHERSGTESI